MFFWEPESPLLVLRKETGPLWPLEFLWALWNIRATVFCHSFLYILLSRGQVRKVSLSLWSSLRSWIEKQLPLLCVVAKSVFIAEALP